MFILDTLKDDEKKMIKYKSYKKGDIIFNEGDKCTSIAYLISGSISISTNTLIDNEYTIKTIESGDSFGEFLLFSSNPYYLGNITCLKESKVAFINRNDLIKLLKENDTFLSSYLNKMSDDALLLQLRIKILAQKTLREKILFFIKRETEKKKTKTIYVTSKETLAKIINVPRPSLSRELKNMEDEGIIKYGRHFITLLK